MAINFDGKGNIESTTEDGVIAVKLYSLEKQIEEKDKEIERLNNITNKFEKWLKDEANFWKQQQEKAIKNGWLEFGGKYNTTIIYENAINKLKELKEALNGGDEE